jgi:hypothetical protein
MKVIDSRPFSFAFECRACGSKLEAEAADVKVGYFGPNWGGETPERLYYVSCVVCGTDRTLPCGKVPPLVQELADKTDPRGSKR